METPTPNEGFIYVGRVLGEEYEPGRIRTTLLFACDTCGCVVADQDFHRAAAHG